MPTATAETPKLIAFESLLHKVNKKHHESNMLRVFVDEAGLTREALKDQAALETIREGGKVYLQAFAGGIAAGVRWTLSAPPPHRHHPRRAVGHQRDRRPGSRARGRGAVDLAARSRAPCGGRGGLVCS